MSGRSVFFCLFRKENDPRKESFAGFVAQLILDEFIRVALKRPAESWMGIYKSEIGTQVMGDADGPVGQNDL